MRPPRGSEWTAPPAGIRRSTRYFPELEALRGIAVLLVYAFHTDLAVMARFSTPDGTVIHPALAFVRGGDTGVSFFFVLSGFLLTAHFLDELHGGPPISRARYAARRALRILPLYYAVVVVATVATARQWGDLRLAIPYLLFLNAYEPLAAPLGAFSGVWWSLATEVQFYLVLPLSAFLLRPQRRRIGLAVLAVYGTAYAAFLLGAFRFATLQGQASLAHSLFGQGPFFLFGACAAWLFPRDAEGTRARWAGLAWVRGAADLMLVATLFALAMVLRHMVAVGMFRDLPPHLAWQLPEGVLWAIVVGLLLLAPLRLKPLFCNRALAALGTISYSYYLVHAPVLAGAFALARRAHPHGFVGWGWDSVLVVGVATALSLIVATVTYRWIERPFLRRKARLDRCPGTEARATGW